MKANVKMLSILGMTLLCLQGCNSNMESGMPNEESATESTKNSNHYKSGQKEIKPYSMDDRKFIRTAKMKFKVDDVVNAAQMIQDVVNANGGFIVHNQTMAAVESQQTVKKSLDSSIQLTSYLMTNQMQISVPEYNLDQTLKTIAPIIQFLDSKQVDAEDVKLKILENELAQKRLTKGEKRIELAIDDKGKNLTSILNAEDKSIEVAESSDAYVIDNLSLQEKVAFSTVDLEMYQNQMVKTVMVPNVPILKPYEIPFFSQIWDGITWGFKGVLNCIVLMSHLWVLLLIIISIYYFVLKKQVFQKTIM